MSLLGSQEHNDPAPQDPSSSSIREILLPAAEVIPDRRLSGISTILLNPGRMFTLLVILAALILSWMCVWGPLASSLEDALTKLAVSFPTSTEIPTPSETHLPASPTSMPKAVATLTVTPEPNPTELPPTSTLQSTTATSTQASDTETPTPQPNACKPAINVTLQDVGQSLCVTGEILRISEKPNAFYIFVEDPADAFYFVSYDRVWSGLKVGQCIFATGKIDQLGNNPIMILSYKIDLEYCP